MLSTRAKATMMLGVNCAGCFLNLIARVPRENSEVGTLDDLREWTIGSVKAINSSNGFLNIGTML